MPITPAALAQHIVDLIHATGFDGAAVVVLATPAPPDDVDVLIGSNITDRARVAGILDVAAAQIHEGTPDTTMRLSPTPPTRGRLD